MTRISGGRQDVLAAPVGLPRRGLLRMGLGSAVGGVTALLARPSGAQAAGFSLGPAGVGGDAAAVRSGTLDVPGARLYYELRGRGALLVLVPGRKGNADSFRNLADQLVKSGRHRVVTYDRRGFSRSQLVGAQDYARRLATDADDVRRLVEHLGDQPATVFGSSSGGLVALERLALFPGVVRTVVPHEPPAVCLLPDGEQWVAFFAEVYATYRESGVAPALQQFAQGTGIEPGPGGGAPPPADGCSYEAANDVYWFERELRPYPAMDLDVDALAPHADRLLLTGGRESRQFVCYQPNTVLAARFGKTIVDLPGGHIGMVNHPVEFARELLAALDR